MALRGGELEPNVALEAARLAVGARGALARQALGRTRALGVVELRDLGDGDVRLA